MIELQTPPLDRPDKQSLGFQTGRIQPPAPPPRPSPLGVYIGVGVSDLGV